MRQAQKFSGEHGAASSPLALAGTLLSSRKDDHIADLTSLTVRYVGVRDDLLEYRLNWVQSLGIRSDEFDFSMNAEIVLSNASSDYDVLIIGIDDVKRAIKYIRQYSDLIRNKILVCLTRKSDPKRRAQLILAGFDDVFDVARTSPVEAVARLLAFRKRYDQARSVNSQQQAEELLLDSIADIRALSPKQRMVLEALVFAPGRSASYAHLCDVASDGPPITSAHLKVIVCNIRKFLKSPFRIVSDRISKYYLMS